MSWITLAEVLVFWTLFGLGVAYLFGRFVQRGELTSADFAPDVLRYLRRVKRADTTSAGTTKVDARRAAGGTRRH